MIYVLIAVIVLVLVLIITNIRIVPQSNAFVIERLGAYHGTWNVGLHVKMPFIDRIVKKVSLKEKVFDFPPQPVITRDNVTMMIDTVVYFQITDPKLYTYGVERNALLCSDEHESTPQLQQEFLNLSNKRLFKITLDNRLLVWNS